MVTRSRYAMETVPPAGSRGAVGYSAPDVASAPGAAPRVARRSRPRCGTGFTVAGLLARLLLVVARLGRERTDRDDGPLRRDRGLHAAGQLLRLPVAERPS